MIMEDKRLQSKINVVKKKMKRVRNQNKLQFYVDIKEKPEFTAGNNTQTFWEWLKEKFL